MGVHNALIDGYQQCLLIAPMPTKMLSTAGMWVAGDLYQQLRSGKGYEGKRSWNFFYTGLGYGLLWACFFEVSDAAVSAIPGTSGPGRVAMVKRTVASMAIESMIWAPMCISGYVIPTQVFLKGKGIREVPRAWNKQFKKLLIANIKISTPAQIIIYNAPLEWRTFLVTLGGIIWSAICSKMTADDDCELAPQSIPAGSSHCEAPIDGGVVTLDDCRMGQLILGKNTTVLWNDDASAEMLKILVAGGQQNTTYCNAATTEYRMSTLSSDELPNELPPGDGETQCGERRQRRRTEELNAEEDWLEIWHTRFDCWWLGLPLPTQQQLGTCMGSLALHLGSKLDAVRGKPRVGSSPARTKPGCEWLDLTRVKLPVFPSAGFEFKLPSIPLFLPEWLRQHGVPDASLESPHTMARLQMSDGAPAELGSNRSNWVLAAASGSGIGAVVALAGVLIARFGWHEKQMLAGRARPGRREAASVRRAT